MELKYDHVLHPKAQKYYKCVHRSDSTNTLWIVCYFIFRLSFLVRQKDEMTKRRRGEAVEEKGGKYDLERKWERVKCVWDSRKRSSAIVPMCAHQQGSGFTCQNRFHSPFFFLLPDDLRLPEYPA